ncbi:uncharacterized protein K452DRAFT_360537 [Aplosporella prunicola CBS 121167]|uniref:Uncharacterized protein n=1 Tax=Aplosporella prunicola CBS 121167 TaxID=1176127 RepID=A0A6A6B548_9PEZI|nr:uncharacterized protein K452DRAFT_360537 [Aplosporella prunicola CBS 121167]KAF2139279.1 hypothetical protein K452DRAFT_360537 [Aplosporella prunicola CBS 121167]
MASYHALDSSGTLGKKTKHNVYVTHREGTVDMEGMQFFVAQGMEFRSNDKCLLTPTGGPSSCSLAAERHAKLACMVTPLWVRRDAAVRHEAAPRSGSENSTVVHVVRGGGQRGMGRASIVSVFSDDVDADPASYVVIGERMRYDERLDLCGGAR